MTDEKDKPGEVPPSGAESVAQPTSPPQPSPPAADAQAPTPQTPSAPGSTGAPETPATPAKPAAPPAAPAAAMPATPAAPPPPKPSPLTTPVPSPALDRLKERFGDQIVETTFYAGEVTVKLKQERLEEIWRFLRDEVSLGFDYLSNLTAVHWPDRPRPFEVVYHLFSIAGKQRITLKIDVGEGEQPVTACRVWPTANWHEREVYDLFGIRFHGHPDMTRILMTDEWVGHPLRKDYPLEGKPEDHMKLREVTTADHVYDYDKAKIKGFGWKKEVEKTGEGRG
jgi:NADH-quinone oxidoreductase subunit C